jgi:hypothetical protein
VTLGRQDRFHQLPGRGSYLLGVFDKPRGRTIQVSPVCFGSVFVQGRGIFCTHRKGRARLRALRGGEPPPSPPSGQPPAAGAPAHTARCRSAGQPRCDSRC